MRHSLMISTLLLPLLVGCGSWLHSNALLLSAIAPRPVFAVPPPAPLPTKPIPLVPCVTFIGDSITNFWPMASFTAYDRGCYIDHGIGGTTLPQILDGIDDHLLPYDASVDPVITRIVVVGGDAVNSIKISMTTAEMEARYVLIIAKLREMGMQVVLCTLLPTKLPEYNVKIVELDAWLRTTAAAQGIPLFDMYAQPGLVLADGTLNPEHSNDGVHIGVADYAPFTPIVEMLIQQAAIKAGL